MELRLPHKWSDLTLGELQVIMTSENQIERLSVCTGKSEDKLRAMPQKLIDAATEHIDKLLTQETARFEKVLTIDGKRLGFIPDWDAFTAGEWIDLETYLEDFWKNAHKVMAVLFREVTYELGERYEIKKYTAKEDASLFEEMSADLVSGTLLFLDYQKRTASQYEVLFTGGSGGSDPVGEKWGWYHILYALSGEDLLKVDSVTELPIQVVFQHLSYLKDRAAHDHVQ